MIQIMLLIVGGFLLAGAHYKWFEQFSSKQLAVMSIALGLIGASVVRVDSITLFGAEIVFRTSPQAVVAPAGTSARLDRMEAALEALVNFQVTQAETTDSPQAREARRSLQVIAKPSPAIPTFLPEQYGIKAALFSDAGTIGQADDVAAIPHDDLELKASAGTSIYWPSPMGPIRFDFSQVLAKEDFDETETFRFSTSTRF